MNPTAIAPGTDDPEPAADKRRVLVTGGTRGIGEAIVRSLAARGRVVGLGYATSQARADMLAGELGAAVHPVSYRLGDPDSSQRAVQEMVDHFGGLDGLVLNAGVWDGGRLTELSRERWETVVAKNLFGAEQLCRCAVPLLAESGAGSVTVISSVIGIIGGPGDTAYAAAKAGLIGFARSLAKESARLGIRVNVLAPGFVETEMTDAIPPESKDRIERSILLRRPGSAEEIAAGAVFLSEDATYATGTVLTLDGGWSL